MTVPNKTAPSLVLETASGRSFDLEKSAPRTFTLLVFYRGYHCAVCKDYLRELEEKSSEFEKLGVKIVAVSGDTKERAEKARAEWRVERIPLAYRLTVSSMKEWGLFISNAVEAGEPEIFAEPAVFLIDRQGKIFFESLASMPIALPRPEDLLAGIRTVIETSGLSRGRGFYEKAHPLQHSPPETESRG